MKKIVLKVIIDPNTGQKRINKSFMPYESIEGDFNQIEIIENPPDLIPKAGYAAEYDFDSQGKLYVKYTEIEKTKIEVLEEELQKVKRAIAEGTIPKPTDLGGLTNVGATTLDFSELEKLN